MNRRGDLQLKLQSTVEGLSVAAITYYIVGLVSYLAKGAQKIGWPFSAREHGGRGDPAGRGQRVVVAAAPAPPHVRRGALIKKKSCFRLFFQ
ncbi:hypothetical protein ALISP_6501 [Alicycliphilus sp. B1]|nr:hypothetical protein ALISP_6501 [Alicycliphilus sp. B1]